MHSKVEELQITDLELPRQSARSRRSPNTKNFVIVPLEDDWGYRAATVAKEGAAIVLYALRQQRMGEYGSGGVPITLATLRRLGITRKVRTSTINRLVAADLAVVRRRAKHRGSPLLTLKTPADGL